MNNLLKLYLLFSNYFIYAYAKPQLFNEDIYLDITLIIIIFLISIVTTIGGVGGGGLLIPTFLLIGKMDLKYAIPLSVVTILGDTVVRIINLFKKKHPSSDKRFLIDLLPLLILVPFDANTSFLGIIMSESFPSIFTIILIIFVLGYTFYKSVKKALETYNKETKFLNDTNNDFELVVIDGIGQYYDREIIESVNSQEVIGDKFREQLLKVMMLFFSILIISIFSITRYLINKCSYMYFIQIIIQFFCISAIGYFSYKFVKNDYEIKRNNHYLFLPGDIVWNDNNIFKFIIIASLTGVLSTYMGIGGGMLTTPVMIEVGMIPEVVIATSSVSTFFSSLITSINYFLAGKLLIDYAIVFSISSGLGSSVGLRLSDIILKKFKRQSIIIFFVALILFTSIILLTYNSILNLSDISIKFNNFCEI